MTKSINVDFLLWDRGSRTFVAELSDLPDDLEVHRTMYVVNPRTGAKKAYAHVGTDRDAGGEDVAGWRFRNAETDTELLLIND